MLRRLLLFAPLLTSPAFLATCGGDGTAPAEPLAPCDPELIRAAVIDRERARLSWLDPFLAGESSVYRGPSSTDWVIGGGEPVHSAWTDDLARLEPGRWLDVESTLLHVFHPGDYVATLVVAQSVASPATTNFRLYASSERRAVCEGCFADLASQPDLITADAIVFRQESGSEFDELTLSVEYTRVPPAELTGGALVQVVYDDFVWSRVSDRWVAAACGNYQGPGRGPFASAWYRAEYFIDDANPAVHGVSAIEVLSCDETCYSPEYEADSCPPYPSSETCR